MRRKTCWKSWEKTSRVLLHFPKFSAATATRSRGAAGKAAAWDWLSVSVGRAKWGSGGEIRKDWLMRVRGPPTDGDDSRRSYYLRRRGLVRPALAPALKRNMYRFRSQLFTGISAAATAHSHPRRFSPLLLAEASPLTRPPHRPTSKKCSSIG